MRIIEFKMERLGLAHIGDEVEITAHEAPSGTCYIIEPAIAMSGCYKGRDRLKATRGVIRDIKQNDRGYYIVAEFEE